MLFILQTYVERLLCASVMAWPSTQAVPTSLIEALWLQEWQVGVILVAGLCMPHRAG